jgi:hypothetical protein
VERRRWGPGIMLERVYMKGQRKTFIKFGVFYLYGDSSETEFEFPESEEINIKVLQSRHLPFMQLFALALNTSALEIRRGIINVITFNNQIYSV